MSSLGKGNCRCETRREREFRPGFSEDSNCACRASASAPASGEDPAFRLWSEPDRVGLKMCLPATRTAADEFSYQTSVRTCSLIDLSTGIAQSGVDPSNATHWFKPPNPEPVASGDFFATAPVVRQRALNAAGCGEYFESHATYVPRAGAPSVSRRSDRATVPGGAPPVSPPADPASGLGAR